MACVKLNIVPSSRSSKEKSCYPGNKVGHDKQRSESGRRTFRLTLSTRGSGSERGLWEEGGGIEIRKKQKRRMKEKDNYNKDALEHSGCGTSGEKCEDRKIQRDVLRP